jgi:hypothetical protein
MSWITLHLANITYIDDNCMPPNIKIGTVEWTTNTALKITGPGKNFQSALKDLQL